MAVLFYIDKQKGRIVSDFIGAIIAAVVFGTIYTFINRGIVTRRKTSNNNDFLYAAWIALGVFVALFAVSFWQTSVTTSLTFVILTYVFGFSFLFRNRTNDKNEVKGNLELSGYADIALRESVQSAQNIIKVLSLDKQKDSDKLMFEMISFSLFITSLHLQREKIPNKRVDEIITQLTETVAVSVADISSSNASREHKLLTSTMQHFYKSHIKQSSESGEMLQTVATSIMAEYESQKSEDFYAMTELVNILSMLGKSLNETGFAKSQS